MEFISDNNFLTIELMSVQLQLSCVVQPSPSKLMAL